MLDIESKRDNEDAFDLPEAELKDFDESDLEAAPAIAGEESTRARVAKVQAASPVARSRACTMRSRPPRITRSGSSAAEE